MKLRNLKSLDQKIKHLTEVRNQNREALFSSSEKVVKVSGAVGEGVYFGQMALDVFQTFTKRNISLKKKLQKVLIDLAIVIAGHLLQNYVDRQFEQQQSRTKG